ncbi:FecR domain-containing protein [Sphingobium boeckii]|uniref:LysM domain-containing protein n=1 Tax=Sphingobium boeckii TaxID=1082345 RepID=A0A7W9EE35_9SPHN|nr:FecR domain-containing protein [Sphingobium boeckii]MBB5684276.1 hypothetical protein [Sphingobium boeckii]
MSVALPLLLLLANPQPIASAPAAEASYRVKKGDTLFDLAEDYFIRPADYRLVQRLNKVTDPRRLPVDRNLRIPRRLLRTVGVEGQIIAFRGEVSILSAGQKQGVAIGHRVREGMVIVTGAKAFVTMALPDGSRVSLPSNSRVGVGRLRQTLLTRDVERAFHLQGGRSEWDVAKAKGRGDSFSVTTPVATAAVRGTSFRVTYDETSGQSTVGVVEGTVSVSEAAAARGDMIAAGSGIAVRAEGRAAPAPLAAAPVLERPGAVQKDEQISFRATPLPGASRYIFELSTDAGFVDRVAESFGAEPAARFDGLPNGNYFVRTSIMAADGVQGLPNTYSFERRLNKVSLDAPVPGRLNGHTAYRFRWRGEGEGEVQYRFTLARDEAGQDRIIDQPGLKIPDVSVTDLEPGIYYWQIWSIRFEDGSFIDTVTPPQKLQIGTIE